MFKKFSGLAVAMLLAGVSLLLLGTPQSLSALSFVAVSGTLLGTNVHTLSDLAKRMDPESGKLSAIVELLGMSNQVLEDMIWKQGNLPTGERTTIRTGLPTVAWRLLNNGVQPSKSTTAQVDVQCGKLEAWCEIDEELVKLNGMSNEYRMSEATAFIEAMNQEFAQTIFYGNSSSAPEEFTGLSPQYSLLSANNGQNIINAGGAGSDNTSIWLIGWGLNTISGLYPKGSQVGLQHNDLGLETVETTAGIAGARMRAYRDQWKWDVGLVVRDWRYAVRIANIDVSLLIADSAGASIKLIELMARALDRIPTSGGVRLAFYANRTIQSMLKLQALNKSTSALAIQPALSQFGHKLHEMTFLGVPVRTSDSLLESEATVV